MDRTFMNQPDLSNINTSHLRNRIDAISAQFINITPNASNTHLHKGIDTTLPPAGLHGAYVNNRPLPTKGVNDRKVYIVGSGLRNGTNLQKFLRLSAGNDVMHTPSLHLILTTKRYCLKPNSNICIQMII
jgi:hypothetical protein